MADQTLTVSALYIYPIKSLRGISLQDAKLTAQGLEHDRRFMLREIKEDGTRRNMACYHDPLMVRFIPALTDPEAFMVQFFPTDGSPASNTIIPLLPDVTELERAEITMHGSPTTGYDMGVEYNTFFSECFGKDVELIYVGANRRQVLGNLSPNAAAASQNTSLISSISSTITSMVSGGDENATHEQGLGLSDVAAVLVVNATSLNHISRYLPEGTEADMTKFRPNIVISGSEEEWEEDYWSELTLENDKKLLLTQNCNRCISLNLDYATGDFATGEEGKVLAKLSKDRRVDPGAKYSPVFGRYGFLHTEAHGMQVKVGESVVVSGRNKERTTFHWPHKVPS